LIPFREKRMMIFGFISGAHLSSHMLRLIRNCWAFVLCTPVILGFGKQHCRKSIRFSFGSSSKTDYVLEIFSGERTESSHPMIVYFARQ
jgi:hypothetical protein